MKKLKYCAGAFAASLIIPQLTDPLADELFGICAPNAYDDTSENNIVRSPAPDTKTVTTPNTNTNTDSDTKIRIFSPQDRRDIKKPQTKAGSSVSEIFANITPDQHYIGLMDTNHSLTEIRMDVYSDDFIAHYKALNVQTFFIERDKTIQPILDFFLQGYMTSDELYNSFSLGSMWISDEAEKYAVHTYIATQMKKMHDAGITIKAIDYVSEMPEIPLKITGMFLNDLSETIQDECGNSKVTDKAMIYYSASRTWMSIAAFPFMQFVMSTRDNETELGHFIMDETSRNGGRSAIFYGAAHFGNHDTSFVTAIGKEAFFNLSLTAGSQGLPTTDTKVDAMYDTKHDTGAIYNYAPVPPAEILAPEF
ncbi:MAG: hypothetical protein CMH27_06580 [Micavibrio sp.]|nr:hypothetical protein [Micavibrio sp.]|tara:strand:+ start:2690 stop:3784 length:1095 start_codon:yes stop_codon:yes gene_type:complete